jgi:hypothetical protein
VRGVPSVRVSIDSTCAHTHGTRRHSGGSTVGSFSWLCVLGIAGWQHPNLMEVIQVRQPAAAQRMNVISYWTKRPSLFTKYARTCRFPSIADVFCAMSATHDPDSFLQLLPCVQGLLSRPMSVTVRVVWLACAVLCCAVRCCVSCGKSMTEGCAGWHGSNIQH